MLEEFEGGDDDEGEWGMERPSQLHISMHGPPSPTSMLSSMPGSSSPLLLSPDRMFSHQDATSPMHGSPHLALPLQVQAEHMVNEQMEAGDQSFWSRVLTRSTYPKREIIEDERTPSAIEEVLLAAAERGDARTVVLLHVV